MWANGVIDLKPTNVLWSALKLTHTGEQLLHFYAQKNVKTPHFSAPKSAMAIIITARVQIFVTKVGMVGV